MELIPESELPFNLIVEETIDGARVQAELDAERREAEELDKAQLNLFNA